MVICRRPSLDRQAPKAGCDTIQSAVACAQSTFAWLAPPSQHWSATVRRVAGRALDILLEQRDGIRIRSTGARGIPSRVYILGTACLSSAYLKQHGPFADRREQPARVSAPYSWGWIDLGTVIAVKHPE